MVTASDRRSFRWLSRSPRPRHNGPASPSNGCGSRWGSQRSPPTEIRCRETIDALDELDCWILAPHDSASLSCRVPLRPHPGRDHPQSATDSSPTSVRPGAYPGVPAVADDIDVLIVRENSEGLYADRNMALGSGEFMPTRTWRSPSASSPAQRQERIAKVAFERAVVVANTSPSSTRPTS